MAATAESTATETPAAEAPGTEAATGKPTPKAAMRTKMVAKVAAKMAEAQTAENLADAGETSAEDGKAKPKKPPEKKLDGKDSKKPDAKAAPGKDDKAKDAPKDGDKNELTKAWRDLRQAKRKFEGRVNTVTEREQRAEAFEKRQLELAEAFEKDPIGWLRARGKNPREVLLRIAKEDGEDPKDKALREVTSKLDTVEKKLTEREQREQDQQKEQQAQQAQKKIEGQILEVYEGLGDDAGELYPNLATKHEPAEVASLARALLLKYYRDTEAESGKGQLLSPEQLFQRLETVLRKKAEATKAKAGKSGTPDRARTAAKSDAESPEDDDESSSRPADVTNRETRVVRPGASGESKEALRSRLVRMAAERIVP